MQTLHESTENQPVEQQGQAEPRQTEFDIAAKRSRDYTDVVIGHVFERIDKEYKASFISGVLSYVLPSIFSSSPASVAKRYYQRRAHGEK